MKDAKGSENVTQSLWGIVPVKSLFPDATIT